jgi:hypothetical protein
MSTAYERLLANARHFQAEQRISDIWELGGIGHLPWREQRIRDEMSFDVRAFNAAMSRIHFLPAVDPVTMKTMKTMKTTGGVRTFREVSS